MNAVKNILLIAGIAGAISVATPSHAAYTLYTGNPGGFTGDSSTAEYRAAQGEPTEFVSFDTLADGTTASGDPIDGSLFSKRVTFSSLTGPLVNFTGAGFNSEIGPNGNYTGTLIITLAQVARAVGFGTVTSGTQVTFFGSSGNVVGTYSPTTTFGFAGLVGDSGSTIKSVRLTGDFFAIQDFQFATDGQMGAVPEPTTWMLMLMGMAGIGFSMRRKEKQTSRVRYA